MPSKVCLLLLLACCRLWMMPADCSAQTVILRLDNDTLHTLHVTGHHESHQKDAWVDLGDIPAHGTVVLRLRPGRWMLRGHTKAGQLWGSLHVHLRLGEPVMEHFRP